jgi:hypothetical protein
VAGSHRKEQGWVSNTYIMLSAIGNQQQGDGANKPNAMDIVWGASVARHPAIGTCGHGMLTSGSLVPEVETSGYAEKSADLSATD